MGRLVVIVGLQLLRYDSVIISNDMTNLEYGDQDVATMSIRSEGHCMER